MATDSVKVLLDSDFRSCHRLSHQREFRHVFKNGIRWQRTWGVVIAAQRTDDGHPRLGIVASRKVGKAVARNRLKRRIRELFRVNKQNIGKGLDLVVVFFPQARLTEFSELARDWEKALDYLRHR